MCATQLDYLYEEVGGNGNWGFFFRNWETGEKKRDRVEQRKMVCTDSHAKFKYSSFSLCCKLPQKQKLFCARKALAFDRVRETLAQLLCVDKQETLDLTF